MFGYKNTACRSLILASVLALTGGVAMAERGGQGPGDGDGPGHRQGDREGKRHHGERGDRAHRGERGQRGPEAMHKRLFADMELTEEQNAQIRETMKAFGAERKAWHEVNKEAFGSLREKMRDARQSKDKDAAEAVREEIKALMESAPKPDAAHDEVRALLNEEQQATFDERITKIRERMDRWKEGRGDGPPHGRHGFGPGEDGPPPPGMDGPPRRGHRGARMFGNLDLTDDQKASLRETMQSDQTREEKMAAVREMLNDEQKAQLDENIEKMRKHREDRKGERGDRGDRRGRRGDGDDDRPRRGRNQDGDGEQLDL